MPFRSVDDYAIQMAAQWRLAARAMLNDQDDYDHHVEGFRMTRDDARSRLSSEDFRAVLAAVETRLRKPAAPCNRCGGDMAREDRICHTCGWSATDDRTATHGSYDDNPAAD